MLGPVPALAVVCVMGTVQDQHPLAADSGRGLIGRRYRDLDEKGDADRESFIVEVPGDLQEAARKLHEHSFEHSRTDSVDGRHTNP
jgi:hypothetical protein